MARTLDSESMGEFNRDIYPAAGLTDAYPDLACLLENKAVEDAFAAAERKAVFWKSVYTWLGFTGLASILIVMLVLVSSVTLGDAYGLTAANRTALPHGNAAPSVVQKKHMGATAHAQHGSAKPPAIPETTAGNTPPVTGILTEENIDIVVAVIAFIASA